MKEQLHTRIFIKLGILQIADNELRRKNGLKKLGCGYPTAHKCNPFNPLTYLVITVAFVLHVVINIFTNIIDAVKDVCGLFKWD